MAKNEFQMFLFFVRPESAQSSAQPEVHEQGDSRVDGEGFPAVRQVAHGRRAEFVSAARLAVSAQLPARQED